MLEELGVRFEGRLHCGLDDSKNIASLLILMIKDGVSLELNELIRPMRTYMRTNYVSIILSSSVRMFNATWTKITIIFVSEYIIKQ